MPSLTTKNYRFAFILITSLFFLWGFAINLNPILIAHLKRSFSLSTFRAALVDSATYIAYFLMALPAGFIIKKYGYKNGIITGLLLFAIGAYLFIPAANLQLYGFFLGDLFIIGCGLTLLETAANPYASALGPSETSTLRLNFSQSFNGLAASLAPLIGAKIILTKGLSDGTLNTMTVAAKQVALASEASSVKLPYFILGSLLVLVAVIFMIIKLPVIQSAEQHVSGKNILYAFKHRHLTWAVISQFMYVGAQTCVFSLFIVYTTKSAEITPELASHYLAFAGAAFLIGRFLGTFIMRFILPQRLLTLFAALCILLCVVAITKQGIVTVYAVVGIAFFMSIMFPTIFALGIKDLKGDTEFGSSLLVMSIVGGAILPPVFGYIVDTTNNTQFGYFVPLVSFAVIFFFGWKGYKVLENNPPL